MLNKNVNPETKYNSKKVKSKPFHIDVHMNENEQVEVLKSWFDHTLKVCLTHNKFLFLFTKTTL